MRPAESSALLPVDALYRLDGQPPGLGPWTLFLDIIGWSRQQFGHALSVWDQFYTFTDIGLLVAALNAYHDEPAAVKAYVSRIMASDMGEAEAPQAPAPPDTAANAEPSAPNSIHATTQGGTATVRQRPTPEQIANYKRRKEMD